MSYRSPSQLHGRCEFKNVNFEHFTLKWNCRILCFLTELSICEHLKWVILISSEFVFYYGHLKSSVAIIESKLCFEFSN